jgi:hypothetical protein
VSKPWGSFVSVLLLQNLPQGYRCARGHCRTIHFRQTTWRNRVWMWDTHTSTWHSSQYQVLPVGVAIYTCPPACCLRSTARVTWRTSQMVSRAS